MDKFSNSRCKPSTWKASFFMKLTATSICNLFQTSCIERANAYGVYDEALTKLFSHLLQGAQQ
jgi:hypothetical protein